MEYVHVKNTAFRNLLEKNIQATPAIWFMRQAGRYHKHYQNLRSKHDFISLCKNPKLAAEVALGPIDDFGFDVAILFSDILFPLDGLGLDLSYDPAPKLKRALSMEDVQVNDSKIRSIVEGLSFQGEALERTREKLPKKTSLVGFVGGIWTLFVYAIQKEIYGKEIFSILEIDSINQLYQNFSRLMLQVLEENIKIQLQHGAEIVYIFDTASGGLDTASFQNYISPSLSILANKFPFRLAYFTKTKNKNFYKQDCFIKEKWCGFVYDNAIPLKKILLEDSKREFFYQGNLDPSTLTLNPSEFQRELEIYVSDFIQMTPEERRGWLFSLGHGVTPQAKEANVRYCVEYVRSIFR